MDNFNNPNETELDLIELLRMIFSRWYIIFGAVFLFTTLAILYSYNMLDDEYTSSGTIVVNASAEGIDSNAEGAYTFSERLVTTYAEIIKTERVMDEVITNLDLDYSPNTIRENLSVSAVNESVMIKVSLTMNEPVETELILTEILDVVASLSESEEINNLQPIDVWDTPKLPTAPSGPNRLLYVAIGFILGGIIGVGIIFIFEFLDKTIKTSKDMEQKLNLRVLGIIPDYQFSLEGDHNA